MGLVENGSYYPACDKHALLLVVFGELSITLQSDDGLDNGLYFQDRSNIGNARVAGLEKELHMTDKQASTRYENPAMYL